jgi:hypothetical protein
MTSHDASFSRKTVNSPRLSCQSSCWSSNCRTQSQTCASRSSRRSPYVDNRSWRYFWTLTLALPRRTSTTCRMPNPSLTRATHERIFCAMTSDSGSAFTPSRHRSQALHFAGANGWPKYSTSTLWRHVVARQYRCMSSRCRSASGTYAGSTGSVASAADRSMIRFQVMKSPAPASSTHSASSPSRPARPASC